MREDYSFGKIHRIVRKEDFARIKKKGKRKHSSHFILLKLGNEAEKARIGIIVTKKVGKANVRNKWKRYIREFFRQNKKIFPASTDFLFIVKRGSEVPKDFQLISEEIKKLIGRK